MTTQPSTTPQTSAPPGSSSPSDLRSRGSLNLNPPGIGFIALLWEDFRTHDCDMFEQGFWAVAVHRFGNWRMFIRNKYLRIPLTLVYRILYKVVEWTCGISFPYVTTLGRRPRLWHHGAMILHARSIGDDVHIRQSTTFGVVRVDRLEDLPVIGNRVDIGCHVCILGGVTIGDDAVIGAGAVVLQDVPAGATAVGVPAKIIKRKTYITQATQDASKEQ